MINLFYSRCRDRHLLPAVIIHETFAKIYEKSEGEMFNLFEKSFKYFEDYWINTRGPGESCVYKQMIRKNNVQDAL